MIVFDSNQLRRILPGNPALLLVKEAAKRSGHTLATTDIVIHEVVRQHGEALNAKVKQLTTAIKEMNALMPPQRRISDPLPTIGFHRYNPGSSTIGYGRAVQKETDAFRTALHDEFRILTTAAEDALESLFREADRRPPCKSSGEGGRDSAIFLTALRHADDLDQGPGGQALPLVFVSEDKVFSDSGSANGRPAPGLQSDIGERNILVCPDVVAALAAMGFPHSELNPAPIIERDDFREMLKDAMLEAAGPFLRPAVVSRIEGAVEVELPRLAEGGKWARQCSDGTLTMTTVDGRWTSRVITKRLENPRRSEFAGFRLSANATALIMQDATGEVIEAQFSPMTISSPF